MSGLSPRALRLYRQSEDPGQYPGLSPSALAALFEPKRLAEIARAGLDEAGVPHFPALVDFGVRYGNRSYRVRGDPPSRMVGIFESWRRIGGPQGIESTRAEKRDDIGWIVQCLESWSGRGEPRAEIVRLSIGETGVIHLDDERATPLASSFDRWLEYEAVLDELGGAGPWQRYRGDAPDGVARRLADGLGLSPVPEASDAFLGVWHTPDMTVRTRPEGPVRQLEVFARREAVERVHAALASLGVALASSRWPA